MTRPYEKLTIEAAARYPRPGTSVPGSFRFTPDSRAVTYLWAEEGGLVRSLWRHDIATGERTVIAGAPPSSGSEGELSRDEELRRERARLRELGVTSYAFAKHAEPAVLLVPGGGRLSIRIGDGALEELPGCEGAIDPRICDDGSKVAFVRDGDLYVVATAGGAPRRLTFDAGDGLTNGLAEFIAQEELDRDHGFWWSPDGSRLAYIRADERRIPVYTIVHQGKDEVDIEQHRYPFAGTANARLQLGVVAVGGGETTRLDIGADDDVYIARVDWRPDGSLTAQVLSRDQRTVRLLAFNLATGQSSLLLEEYSQPWLNLGPEARFLESGEMLWASERSGYCHLYLFDAAGALVRQLTFGEWVVTGVVHVDENRRVVYFNGTRDSVLERHLYSVSLDGDGIRRLTDGGGWHGAVFSPDGTRYVEVTSSRNHGPIVRLTAGDSEAPALLFANDGASARALGLVPPEFATFTAADGVTQLHGALYRPPGGAGNAAYPLIVSVYGGPHAQRVADEWSLTVDLRAQYLSQQGYLVLRLDNRGSANRGLAFEAAISRNLGSVEVADQAAAVHQLVERGMVDPARIGVFGWSYGGYMTLLCMLRAADVFRAGVAGAPVTHWDGYDTAYTERYMGTPQDNPGGYSGSAVLTHVTQLKGALLLVHGMVDENVHFRHTARLMVALAGAGKDYEVLAFPEERHMPRDAVGLEYQERRVIGFLLEHV